MSDEPPFDLEHPDEFHAEVRERQLERELRSPRSVAVYAATFVGGMLLAGVLLDAGLLAWLLAGGFAAALAGQPLVRKLSEARAARHAEQRLRAALQEHWRREREWVNEWGASRGLVALDDAGFTAPLDTTPILLEGARADYANVLRGQVGDGTATFFHLTQIGEFPGASREGLPAFRWLTCVHMKRRRRDLLMTLHPRFVKMPPCGLNRVPINLLGDAWRSPNADGTTPDRTTEEDPRGAATLARMVDAGILPPSTLEHMRELEHAEGDDRRRALLEQIEREGAAWRGRTGARQGMGAMVDLMRAVRDKGWREVKLESIAFNERYLLRTKEVDDLGVVTVFDPALIVEMTEAVSAVVLVEMHYDNLVIAAPGRLLETQLLDELLRTAEQLGRHVDEAPAPA